MYFPLVDHLVQELNDRLLSQENHFSGQYLVSANSGVQDKLYEINKTDILEKRDFDILRWQTKWSHSSGKKYLNFQNFPGNHVPRPS